MKRFRGGLVGKAHRLVYHSTLGWRVIRKKQKHAPGFGVRIQGCNFETKYKECVTRPHLFSYETRSLCIHRPRRSFYRKRQGCAFGAGRSSIFLEIQPCVKSLRSSYTRLYSGIAAARTWLGGVWLRFRFSASERRGDKLNGIQELYLAITWPGLSCMFQFRSTSGTQHEDLTGGAGGTVESHHTAADRSMNNFQGCKTFYTKAMARIRP